MSTTGSTGTASISGPTRVGITTSTKDREVELTVTFTPANLVSGASIHYQTTTTSQASTVSGSVTKDPIAGTMKFKVTGDSPSLLADDLEVIVRGPGFNRTTHAMTIVVPTSIGSPRPAIDNVLPSSPKNLGGNSASVPAVPSVSPGEWLLYTALMATPPLDCEILDQTGTLLENYDDEDVYELSGGTFYNLNVKINGGKYDDNVGYTYPTTTPTPNPTISPSVKTTWESTTPTPQPANSTSVVKDIRILPSNDTQLKAFINVFSGVDGVDGGNRQIRIDSSNLVMNWA